MTPPVLTEDWVRQLDAYLDLHGFSGHDPFDVKAHPLLRRMQTRPLLRKTTTLACDLFPNAARRLLRIAPRRMRKSHALVAHGALRMLETDGEERWLRRAAACLAWLRDHARDTGSGLGWGYPFDVHGSGVHIPAGEPIVVVTAIAGEAFLQAHKVTGQAVWLDLADRTARSLLHDARREETGEDTWCFTYAATDPRLVHNANLLAVAFLLRWASIRGDHTVQDALAPALAFSLKSQHEDGAFPYGHWVPGSSQEPALMTLVDHHHTGFVLRALHSIAQDTGQPETMTALRRGYTYYAENLLRPDGMPVNAYGAWPVDIHACAEAVLCGAALSVAFPEAMNGAKHALDWTSQHLRRRSDGAPYYRRYPGFTSRLVCTRWGWRGCIVHWLNMLRVTTPTPQHAQ